MMLQDYSIKHTNVLQNSNSLHSHVTINFRDFIDIYEYLDDACDLPTRKLTNDDVDKSQSGFKHYRVYTQRFATS